MLEPSGIFLPWDGPDANSVGHATFIPDLRSNILSIRVGYGPALPAPSP
jgi:hypothetical protein